VQDRALRTRQTIVAAAARVFARSGDDGAAIAEILAEQLEDAKGAGQRSSPRPAARPSVPTGVRS
jgi:hypothetical protein